MKDKNLMLILILAIVFLMAGILNATNGDLVVKGNFNLLPAGSMIMFGCSTPPEGWLLADGSEVSRTEYVALFAAIGTTFGAGDGTSTFNLPDFRGVFPKGAGTTDRATGKDASGNAYTTILGAYTQDRMQGHAFKFNRNLVGVSTAVHPAGALTLTYSSTPSWYEPINPTLSGDDTNGTPRIGSTTEPQSLGVNFIVKY